MSDDTNDRFDFLEADDWFKRQREDQLWRERAHAIHDIATGKDERHERQAKAREALAKWNEYKSQQQSDPVQIPQWVWALLLFVTFIAICVVIGEIVSGPTGEPLPNCYGARGC